ncbi:unnamed protein product [Cylicocyclus nassatus]|uniref:Uncharacterized protein n=1 Tax=Cylicocyclus nassatus TaxID=53992 RepID=A0AA36GWY8_CYLNA|nr:unnamed protein product [Cylicocyclus nassatus]
MHSKEVLCLLSLIIIVSEELKCYSGSKGKFGSNIRVDKCEDGMKYCFKSQTNNKDEITASCQTLNTGAKLLSICKTGCRNDKKLGITVCCCKTDLCNA